MTDDKRIITPNNGRDRKVVGIDNKPIKQDDSVTEMQVKDKIIAALRDLASKLEDGTLSEPEFIVLIPKFKDGDTSLLFFGEACPTVMVEGTIHKVLTRMAMA